MNIDIKKIFGRWQLKTWESRLLDSGYQDVYLDKRINVLSTMNVWETKEWYSNFYSALFNREFKISESLNQYTLNFKSEIDHKSHYETELVNSKTNKTIRRFWWEYLVNEDGPSNTNMEISMLDYATYGNIDYVDSNKLILTDITEGVNINGKINFEYAVHQLGFEKIVKESITTSEEQAQPKKLSSSWIKRIFK